MPWIFSIILYDESVKIYDKSIDMLKWMQVGLRTPGAGVVPLRKRQAQSRKFEFFPKKWKVAEVVAIKLSFLSTI